MEPTEDKDHRQFIKKVGEKEKRMLKAKFGHKRSIWFGLGMFGMVGWSIAMPTLLGAVLGIWLDKTDPEPFSWTITFLMIGLILGCIIAWNWVSNEDKEMRNNKDETKE